MINIYPKLYSPARVGQAGLPVINSLYISAALDMPHRILTEMCIKVMIDLPPDEAKLHFCRTHAKTLDNRIIPCFEITGEGMDYFDSEDPRSRYALDVLTCVYAAFDHPFDKTYEHVESIVNTIGRKRKRARKHRKILKTINAKLSN